MLSPVLTPPPASFARRSRTFMRYRDLVCRSFMAIRKRAHRVILLVEMIVGGAPDLQVRAEKDLYNGDSSSLSLTPHLFHSSRSASLGPPTGHFGS